MLEIAKASEEDRRVLFSNTAAELGLNPAIVEKDFWEKVTILHKTAAGYRSKKENSGTICPSLL